jgi:hypothetical protein
VGDTVVAVAGTLPGSLPTALPRSRGTRAARRADDLRAAPGSLAAATGDHRRALWRREHLRASGAPAADRAAARVAGRTIRSAVTAPRVAASVPEPGLAPAARAAAQAAFGMRGAADLPAPAALREHAVTATGSLVAVAGRTLREGA